MVSLASSGRSGLDGTWSLQDLESNSWHPPINGNKHRSAIIASMKIGSFFIVELFSFDFDVKVSIVERIVHDCRHECRHLFLGQLAEARGLL